MANPNSLPLYEKYWYKHNYKRVLDSLILFLLLLLLGYRVIFVNNYSFPWFVALICETWFTISWIFTLSTQWSPAFIKTYPERLLQRYTFIKLILYTPLHYFMFRLISWKEKKLQKSIK
jgi:hypothetical protein